MKRHLLHLYLILFLGIVHSLLTSCSSLTREEISVIPVIDHERTIMAIEEEKQFKTSSKNSIDIVYNHKHYDFWLNYFTTRERARFQRHLNNGDKFEELIFSIFKSYDLPTDLYFLGLIESGYNIHARSHASAVGPWQFMKKTAQHYGMRVDRYVDERRNIVKSTHGAAQYLKDLYNILGSWELAFCAYNAGEYRIINAIRKGNTRDYRELVKKKLIPLETINYIPKMAAAREVAKNRELYGFVYGSSDEDLKNIKKVTIKKSFSFKEALKKMGSFSSVVKKLNPDIKSNLVRVSKPFDLIVPKNFQINKSTFRGSSVLVRVFNAKKKNKVRIHRVKKGEFLLKIAKRYGVSVRSLMKANKMKSTVLAINQRITIPKQIDRTETVYIVKRGDNLFNIAKRFNSSIKKIIVYNQLKTQKIYPKQTLYIPIGKS